MKTPPKITKATAYPDHIIEVIFDNDEKGKFNFENYFEYQGYYQFLNDISSFLKIKIHPQGNYVFWLNSQGEEIEIDPAILYAICAKKPVIINNKIVFDPSLGKNAWI